MCFLILVISIRWFQNVSIVFPDMFDDLQSFPAYVPLVSNQVVPKILEFSIVFSMCFNWFAIYISMSCNDFPLVFLWFSVNLDDFWCFLVQRLLCFWSVFQSVWTEFRYEFHWIAVIPRRFSQISVSFSCFFHSLWLKNVRMPGSALLIFVCPNDDL